MNIESKLPNVGTTIFTVMSQLAQSTGAINLSQGYPDFDPPERLLDLLNQSLRQGQNQYPPMTGVPYLREQIALKMKALYAADVDVDDEITVTSGATEALFVAISTIVKPGDEVIVFDPAYDSYEPAVTLAGGTTVHIPLLPGSFALDLDAVRDHLSPKTAMIVLNSPHNPCGSVVSAQELDELANIIRETRVVVLSDEVYEHMVFDGAPHLSVAGHKELAERAFVVSSFGKTYHATGWKVAYCTAPVALMQEFRKIHQYVTFTTHTPTQWALAAYLQENPDHYNSLPAFYQTKRDLFNELMQTSAFTMTPSAGTYFQLADYSQISDIPDTEFARHLTTEYGVAVIPISVFYETPPQQNIVRFCFAKSDDTLKEAAGRLHGINSL